VEYSRTEAQGADRSLATGLALKRAMDIVLSLVAMVVLFPLLVVIAAAVKIDSRGPVLFKQERLGRGRKPFTMYKFRSMRADSGDALHREAVKRTAQSKRREIGTFKSLDDPRVYELPYYKDWFFRRFAVRPGLTGLWQVKRADAEDFDEMIRMDVDYTERMSVWLDLKLIALTIPSIIREKGTF